MESILLEELGYINDELRKTNEKPYEMTVRNT